MALSFRKVYESTSPLTTSADNILAGSGNDTISGLLTDPGNQQTFQSWDTIDGGAGINTLNVQNNGANVIAATLANIQRLNFQDTTAGGALVTLSLNGLSSLTNVNLSGNGAASGYAVLNLGSLPTVNLTGTSVGSTINFTAAALAPAAQTFNITLNAVTAPVANVLTLSDVGNNALETVNLVSATSANTLTGLTTSGLGVTTLNISGTQNLTLGTITDTNSTLRTVDASQALGNVSLTAIASSTVTGGIGNDTITSGGGTDNFTGGAGSDVFDFATTGSFANTDSVAGGEGTGDVIRTTAANFEGYTAPVVATVSGIEQLRVSTAGTATATLNTTFIQSSGINTVSLGNNATGAAGVASTAGAYTVVFAAGASTLNLGSTATSASGVLAGALTVNDTGSATSDSLTINNNSSVANVATDVFANQALTFNGMETVTLNTGSIQTVTGAITTNAITLTGDANADTRLNITGSNTATTGAAITATTIDASGLTGNAALTQTIAAIGATSILGSNNADTLRASAVGTSVDGGAGADNIFGGAGNDSLIGGTGNDTITGNGGVDTIRGGEGDDRVVTTLIADNVVDGGAGTNTLQIAAAATAATGAGVSNFQILRDTVGLTQNMLNFVDNASAFTRINTIGAVAGIYSNVGSNVTTLGIDGATGAALVTSATFIRAVDTTSNALTINITNNAGGTDGAAIITADEEETITITSTNATGVAANPADVVVITDLAANDLTSLILTGGNSISVGTGILSNMVNLATVNASTATGSVNTVNASTSAVSVTFTSGSGTSIFTGGAAADLINGSNNAVGDVLVGNADGDIINGLAGNDSITGGTGADTMNGGSGSNDYIYTAAGEGSTTVSAAGNWTGFDRITTWNVGSDQIDQYLNPAAAYLTVVLGTTGAADLTTANYTNQTAAVNYFNDVAVVAAITGIVGWAAGDDAFIGVTLNNGTTALYEINNTSGPGGSVAAADINLVGLVSGVVAAADIV